MVAVGPCQLLAVRVEKLVTGVHISTPLLHTVTISATSTISDRPSHQSTSHLCSRDPGRAFFSCTRPRAQGTP